MLEKVLIAASLIKITDLINFSQTFRLYKNNNHEGGISTPLIMCRKGKIINPGSINNYPSHLIDIMPTVLEEQNAPKLTRVKR